MSKQDYYEVLGVSKDVDAKALKSAYRKLALKYHPDQNPGDDAAEAKFKEVGEAYAILSDPEKRAAYDRFGHAAFDGGGAGPGGGNPFGQGDPGDIFENIFSQVFGGGFGGGGRRRNGPARGNDLRYDLEISLEDAFTGKDTEITLPTAVDCGTCEGSGAEPGTSPETCPTCQGAGRVRAQQGFFTMERTCARCSGRGKVIPNPCKTCGGAGQVREERTLQVKIPAGVESGMRIRLAGEGEPGLNGGPKGDLYIFIDVSEHDIFERDGPNLYCPAPVPMVTAALGGEIEIPTIDGGRARVTVPEGAQTGRKLRLRGKGMPSLRGSGHGGDLFVEMIVETPCNLSARQKELLREFCECSGADCNPESEGFLGRVKKFWDGMTGEDGQRPN
ncbi:MAG TPA: molecular chaperone DnaJ [Henriciella marina]|uniref:molecular chaperone DnaJ n=1 Tax=Henriciella sp. TaxID=1968823 RepID=UPI00185B3958|nr:molecular chaperone DnaJ [Henriciella sp.]HIG21644.1 molecular chaperone DnaJ [Henriciella sp.]HIK63470.1 molecular chaperone DnaJ [Henriciella marina]